MPVAAPPPDPCEICGSTEHTTGYHEQSAAGAIRTPPADYREGDYPTTLDTEEVLETRRAERE